MTAHTHPIPGGEAIAAFFDLDKTVIARSSILAFSKPFLAGGLISRRSVLASSYAQFLFLFAGADRDQTERMRAHLTSMCAGWEVEQVRAIVSETLHQVVEPLVYAEAADLIADHKARGHDVVVVSASGDEVVAPIAALLGADYCAASRMAVENGRFTGELEFYCHGEGKAEVIRELAATHGYDLTRCYAYSDSSTDLPMLESVGNPRAVNPDRTLRRAANEKGWPTLTFSNPVPIRARIPTPSAPSPQAAAALAVAGVAAGALTYTLLRRRH